MNDKAAKTVDIDLPPKQGGTVTVIDNQPNGPGELAAPSVAQSEASAIIAMIERAARDPAIELAKMQGLMAMRNEEIARQAKGAFDDALARMQMELPVIPARGEIKNSAGKVQSRYAKWEDVNDLIKPILSKYGFVISFRTGTEGNLIKVTAILAGHGHREETTMSLPLDASGAKNAVQGVGSSTSYGKRYTAGALLNLTSRGEDDDGAKAGAAETISDDQLEVINKLMTETGSDFVKFCEAFEIAAVPDLPASKFNRAIGMLQKKKAKAGAKK